MKKKSKSNVGTIIAVFFLVAALLFMGISSFYSIIGCASANSTVNELLENQDGNITFVKGKIYMCSPRLLSLRHTVNFIPVETEYFYVIFEPEKNNCMVIKAPEDWDIKNFQDFYNPEGIEISGQVKRMNYQVRNEFTDFLSLKEYSAYSGSINNYLDLTATSNGWVGLIAFLSLIVAVILIILISKQKLVSKASIIVSAVLFIIAVIFILKYIY